MMESYDGSTESDEDGLLALGGDSYEALVRFRGCCKVANVIATCPADQGQNQRLERSKGSTQGFVRAGRIDKSYAGHAGCF